MKRLLSFACCLVVLAAGTLLWAPSAAAQEEPFDGFSELYGEQFRESGAQDLPGELPNAARESLNQMGVEGADWSQLASLSPQAAISVAAGTAEEAMRNPLRAAASVLSVLVICALRNGLQSSMTSGSLSQAAGLAGTLCVASLVVQPILTCLQEAAAAVEAASGFQLACVPVMAGILLANGEPARAASYETMTTLAGSAVSLVSQQLLVPLIGCFLALSLVASVCPVLKLGSLCELFSSVVKWVLGFVMTLFSGVLTVHSIVTSSADSAASRAVKFAVSSFVPVVGNALGEALRTVSGCVGVLKSGVTAFVLLAEAVLFLPSLLQCMCWRLVLAGCAAAGDALGQHELAGLLSAAAKAAGLLLAILLCCMLAMTVSSVAVVLVGGGGNA